MMTIYNSNSFGESLGADALLQASVPLHDNDRSCVGHHGMSSVEEGRLISLLSYPLLSINLSSPHFNRQIIS